MFLNLTSTPKIAPTGQKITLKGPKGAKRPKIWPNLKQKIGAVLQKQKLIVYISRFQICFLILIYPKNNQNWPKDSPEGPKKGAMEA